MRILGFWSAAILLSWTCVSAQAADIERGRVLYEARCDLCHRTSIHVREARKAQTFDGLRQQVARWNTEIGGGTWSRDEVDDVTLYLNNRYYRFECPASLCAGGRARTDPQQRTAIVEK